MQTLAAFTEDWLSKPTALDIAKTPASGIDLRPAYFIHARNSTRELLAGSKLNSDHRAGRFPAFDSLPRQWNKKPSDKGHYPTAFSLTSVYATLRR